MADTEHTALIVDGKQPSVAPTAWIAPTAVLAGAVTVEEEASICTPPCCADRDTITIDAAATSRRHDHPRRSRIPGDVGAGVSVGHRAVLHGCHVGDDCLIGMSATVLNARIGAGTLVAAGAGARG